MQSGIHSSSPDAATVLLSHAPERQPLILLAEDDTAVRTLLARVLRAQGYTVVEAANGDEAVLAASASPLPFQLLLTDVMMPRLNGPDLAARLLRDGHTSKVIFMTGYSDVVLDEHEYVTVLRKPFTPSVLAEVVRAALAQ
jgi:two-component system cell cycle sensor histidine kinase/response regulator CckA